MTAVLRQLRWGVLLAWSSAPAAWGQSLAAGIASGQRGDQVSISLSYDAGGGVVALQLELAYDAASVVPGTVVPGAALGLTHQIATNVVAPGNLRVVVWSNTNTPLAAGAIAMVPFTIAQGASEGSHPLTLSAVVMSDAGSSSVAVAGLTPGDIEVKQPTNRSPVANAGSDRSVPEGTLVTLDGSASSDPDLDPLSFSWSQTQGTAVTLSDRSVAKPTFRAPLLPGLRIAFGGGQLTGLRPDLGELVELRVPLPGEVRAEVAVTQSGSVWLLREDGVFRLGVLGFRPVVGAGTDLDHDGEPELLLADAQGDVHALAVGRGEPLAPELLVRTTYAVASLAMEDVNGDGTNDLALVDTAGNIHVLLSGGGGLREERTIRGRQAREVWLADLDGDQSIDLAFADVSGEVYLLEGEGLATDRPAGKLASSATANELLRFALSVSDGRVSSSPDSVDITVARHSFSDVLPNHVFYEYIEKFYEHRITGGCSSVPLLYCPDNNVTRGQMAVFMVRALGLQADSSGAQRFQDVPPNHVFYGFIQKFASLGITGGCSAVPPLYCPDSNVTRGQMAVFMVRALGLQPDSSGAQRFQDVPPTHPFYGFIQKFASLGITSGCSSAPPLYCPDNNVSRGQMAVFMVRAFGW